MIEYPLRSSGKTAPLAIIPFEPSNRLIPTPGDEMTAGTRNVPWATVDKVLLKRNGIGGRGTTIVHLNILNSCLPSDFLQSPPPYLSSSSSPGSTPRTLALCKISFTVKTTDPRQDDVVRAIKEAPRELVSHLGKVDLLFREEATMGIPGVTKETYLGATEKGVLLFRERTILISKQIYQHLEEVKDLRKLFVVHMHFLLGKVPDYLDSIPFC